MTAKAGLEAAAGMPAWTTSAVWFDYDNDGRLDLFVGSYVQYQLSQGLLCAEKKKDGSLYYHYCIPHLFKPTPSALFHNNGDGTFRQVSGPTAIGRTPGKALGAVATDINNDGLIDLVVANDTSPNFLFLNRGKNVWRENGVAAGMAFSASGNLRSGMGVDAADFNGDGWQDVFIANIDHEMFSLYESHAGAYFTDGAPDHGARAGHAAPERLGREARGLRQRRLRRPADRERPPGRHDRLAGARRQLQGTAAAVPP